MQERQVAHKMDIKAANSGKYVQIDRTSEEDKYTPNYVEMEDGKKISRVRIMATVLDKYVSEDGNYASLTLDDTTDTIRCKIFKELDIIETIEKGDLVDLVGKLKEYNEERYIQPEIMVRIENPNFEVLRILELKKSVIN
ncbi:MAG: OB-fold nucleic acid binding domain-containing protein [Candidatus Aenigmarchaeota archaeon]|nr:OB-fold nucleic acid binding domain-containing protein [Candidatus Aenigmarchaeota archaeon]